MTQGTYFEATPDGINFMVRNDDGIYQHIKINDMSAFLSKGEGYFNA